MSAVRVPTPLPIPTIAAFAALTLALSFLWTPRVRAGRFTISPWIAPGALAVATALAGDLIDLRALPVIVGFAAACAAARHSRGAVSIAAHAAMLVVAAGLFLHAWPGFHNPVVISDAVLGRESQPYTKYPELRQRTLRPCSSSASTHPTARPRTAASGRPTPSCGDSSCWWPACWP